MQNDLKYTVRSREIVDLVSAMRTSRLTLSPYFQRNLVWRDAHKRDFIDTILKGYPFPQIFLSRGPINVETMEASQAVVDGQQRLNAIQDFLEGRLEVGDKKFKDLTPREKEEFLKYEVAVIDFDLDAGDPRLKDVFHRLNRTYYSLSAIEKLASEYSASEFLLVARMLSGEIKKEPDEELDFEVSSEDDSFETIESNIFSRDPGVDEETWQWLTARADGAFATLLQQKPIFTKFEFDRKVPLMFTLNIMCTFLTGYYNRNDRVRKFLEEKADDFSEKDQVVETLNATAAFIREMELPDRAMWWNKANFFTLVCELSKGSSAIKPMEASRRLMSFQENVPSDYSLAAREAVGRKNYRELRGKHVRAILDA